MVKNLPAKAGDIRDAGSIPGLGRSPGGGHGNPLQYSSLENPLNGLVVFSRLVSRQKGNKKSKAIFLVVPMGTTSNFFCEHLCPEIHRPSIIHITEAVSWLLQAHIPTFQG